MWTQRCLLILTEIFFLLQIIAEECLTNKNLVKHFVCTSEKTIQFLVIDSYPLVKPFDDAIQYCQPYSSLECLRFELDKEYFINRISVKVKRGKNQWKPYLFDKTNHEHRWRSQRNVTVPAIYIELRLGNLNSYFCGLTLCHISKKEYETELLKYPEKYMNISKHWTKASRKVTKTNRPGQTRKVSTMAPREPTKTKAKPEQPQKAEGTSAYALFPLLFVTCFTLVLFIIYKVFSKDSFDSIASFSKQENSRIKQNLKQEMENLKNKRRDDYKRKNSTRKMTKIKKTKKSELNLTKLDETTMAQDGEVDDANVDETRSKRRKRKKQETPNRGSVMNSDAEKQSGNNGENIKHEADITSDKAAHNITTKHKKKKMKTAEVKIEETIEDKSVEEIEAELKKLGYLH